MAVPVRIPSEEEDRPRWAVLATIAAASLVIGLGIARCGTHGPGSGSGSGPATRDGTGTAAAATDPAASPAAVPEPSPLADPDPGPSPVASPDADPDPGPSPVASPDPDPDPGPSPVASPDPDPDPVPSPVARPDPAPSGGFRVVRGRVAYLRCDGVPQRAGPVPCPRDEALEQQVWGAIDRLLECTAMPRTAGEADLVVDFLPGAIPETRARDTFARDVVRLDAERVVACLGPQLATVTQSVGASRLVVSFRFALVADPAP